MHFVRAQKPRLHAQFLAKYLKSTEVVENDEHDLIVLTTVLEYVHVVRVFTFVFSELCAPEIYHRSIQMS